MKKDINEIYKDITSLEYSEIVNYCNELFPQIPISVIDFENERFAFKQREFGGVNVVYRARLISNSDNKPHETVSAISYIPQELKEKITEYGRVNKPNQPMFYGSFDFATACTEAVTKGNVFENKNSVMLTVGVWKFTNPLKLVKIPHSERRFKEFYDEVNFESESIKLEHIEAQNIKVKEQFGSEEEYKLLELFADEFATFNSKSNIEYRLSNYYADRVFNKIDPFIVQEQLEGIIYPSLALSYQHNNIVLPPEIVDQKLEFVEAMQVWMVISPNSEGAQFIPIKQRVHSDPNGTLKWNKTK